MLPPEETLCKEGGKLRTSSLLAAAWGRGSSLPEPCAALMEALGDSESSSALGTFSDLSVDSNSASEALTSS